MKELKRRITNGQYKTWTVDCGLGVKHGMGYKKHYGLRIKYGLGYKTQIED